MKNVAQGKQIHHKWHYIWPVFFLEPIFQQLIGHGQMNWTAIGTCTNIWEWHFSNNDTGNECVQSSVHCLSAASPDPKFPRGCARIGAQSPVLVPMCTHHDLRRPMAHYTCLVHVLFAPGEWNVSWFMHYCKLSFSSHRPSYYDHLLLRKEIRI